MSDNNNLATLQKCLFTLIDSLNIVVDRLDGLADRHEQLVEKNHETFTKIKEEVWRKIIEHEVNQHIEKDKRLKQ